MLKNKKILIGVCGGIAAYKIASLCSSLKKKGAEIRIIMTESATKFITPLTLETMGKCKVYTDIFAGEHDQVMHIELAKWADVFLVAPLTASTLAKMVYGLADNFLTATFLAYDGKVIVCPSMNTNMLHNEATQRNLDILSQRNIDIIPSQSGILACNTVGDGRLRDVEDIIDILDYKLEHHDLSGKKIIVSAGATIEPIDYVRYITNHSSGKMGYAIAKRARDRGAEVVLVTGKSNPYKINDITRIEVTTNEDMKDAIDLHFKDSDCLIMAAAPCDYKTNNISDRKLKKTGNDLNLTLVENVDILKYFSSIKDKQTIIGFAAETDNVIENAHRKLEKKKVDYIVANDLKNKDAGFFVDTNKVTIISKNEIKEYPTLMKEEVADIILNLL